MRLLFDEDFNGHIIRGLFRRLPDLDVAIVFHRGLAGSDDTTILRIAARENRLLVSHDVNTMTSAFRGLSASGESSCGLLLVPQSLSIGQAIDELELICVATENEQWADTMSFLPI